MAGPSLRDRAAAASGALRKALPVLKPKVPSAGRAPDPFEVLEDETDIIRDDFEPNAAPDLGLAGPGPKASGGGRGSGAEAVKSLFDALLGSKLALGVVLAALVLVLGLLVTEIIVNSPPRMDTGAARATADGTALLRRVILPPRPDVGVHVELERETDRVYTVEDAARFATDPASIDISGLEARNKAEIDALFKTVP
jgi:hypothetical protein